MTKQLTISVPDDVAERLALEPNVSAFVTTAIQRHMMVNKRPKTQKTTREILESVGFTFTEERLDEAKRELDEMKAKMTPELRKWARDFIAKNAPHRLASMGDD